MELNPYLSLGIAHSLNQEPHPQPVLPVPAVPGNQDNNDDNDGGEVSGPLLESHIDLVKMAHKWLLIVLLLFIFLLTFPEHWLQPHNIAAIVDEADFCKQLQLLIRDQQQDNDSKSDIVSSSSDLPSLPNKIFVYTSTVATFYAPSDISGISGMRSERIHAINTWCHGNGCYDCMFVNTYPLQLGMCGLDIAHARLFFSFTFEWVKYSCAFIYWFLKIGESVDEGMGMWSVEPEVFNNGSCYSSIIHLDSVVHLAHLLSIHYDRSVPSRHQLNYNRSLDAFSAFYVNKYANHHAFDISFYLLFTVYNFLFLCS